MATISPARSQTLTVTTGMVQFSHNSVWTALATNAQKSAANPKTAFKSFSLFSVHVVNQEMPKLPGGDSN